MWAWWELYEWSNKSTEALYDEVFQEIFYVNWDDINKIPFYFSEVLKYKLASELSIPITGSDKQAQQFYQLFMITLKKARHIDASQDYPDQIHQSSYITVRR